MRYFHRSLPLLLVVLFSGIYATAPAAQSDRNLVIISSFPAEMTSIFSEAFEKKNPGIRVELIKKKTSVGLKYINENKNDNSADLFWVSAPDAFEVLKEKNLLQQYQATAQDLPKRISGYPVNDPDGYYTGFAVAGYGIMWNNDYLKAHNLPTPKEWIDLTKPVYRGHIGLCSPSRSGTTHLTIEAILQLKGWKPGWSLVKAISANAKTITKKSADVPNGVIAGDFGVGIVIDYYALTAMAQGQPVGFAYPGATTLVPANIGMLKNAPEAQLAGRFIDFIVSPEGQRLLLSPQISRLPISPDAYEDGQDMKVPAFFPRPFTVRQLGAHIAFDVQKSRLRYNVVNSLFDAMITYRLDELRSAMQAVQAAEQLMLSTPAAGLPAVARAVIQGRDLIRWTPIDELTSRDPKFTAKFKKTRKQASDIIDGEQGNIEQQWDQHIVENYARTRHIIDLAYTPPDS